MKPIPSLLAAVPLLLLPAPASALGPQDVYLVVNKNVPESRTLAEHYCKKRAVPPDHIIALDLPRGEDISRRDYDEKIRKPLREQLADKREQVKVLLTFYGVPLRVGRPEPSAEKEESEKVRQQMEPLQKKVSELETEIRKREELLKTNPKDPAGPGIQKLKEERDPLHGQIRKLEERRRYLIYAESEAAVDSELSLLWVDGYELRRWQLNFRHFQAPEEIRTSGPAILMTCRLDGPTVELIKSLIDTSVEVEARGLSGKVYVDARGIKYNPKGDTGFGYGGYDESLREMARLLDKEAKLPVTLDDKPELFAPGSCPEAALYCGWYSLAKYVDSCKFVPGAVAFHIASAEAVTLRDPNTKQWCKCLLERGVVATLGPVAEPYTIGFPKPAEFFGFLVTGEHTLVECYWKTVMLTSWMTVLIGDPLYNPYSKTPKLKSEQVKPSPVGGQPFIIRKAR